MKKRNTITKRKTTRARARTKTKQPARRTVRRTRTSSRTKKRTTKRKTTKSRPSLKSISLPTKRNKAGKQQPYIPKGYGDASGEYTGLKGHRIITKKRGN